MGSAGYIRRFTSEPTEAELLAIEGLVIIDRDPPAAVNGAGTGTVQVVGEFEDGPFNTPTQIASGNDLLTTFGSFGFTYDGIPANNPCARARKSDAAIRFEYWNGNGYIALTNKKFAGLVVQRVDTSVGSVEFTRLASLSGASDFTFALTSGQTVIVNLGAGLLTATFTGVAATKLSADGTFPTTFVGGESISYSVDGVSYTTVFLASDQTHAQMVARMNATIGYTGFVSSTLKTSLTGRLAGSAGSVQITAVSSGLVTTASGFSVGAVVNGTGNVANISQISVQEANTIIAAAATGVAVDRDANGKIRIINTATPGTGTLLVSSTGTATAFGWATDTTASAAAGNDGVIPAGTRVRNGGAVEWVTMQTVAVTNDNAGPYSVKVRPALDDGTIGAASTATVTVVPSPIALDAFAVLNPAPLAAALTEAAIDAKYVTALAATTSPGTVSKIVNVSVSARQSNTIRSALKQNAQDASANGCFGRDACLRPPLNTLRAVARSSTAQPGVGAYRSSRTFYCFPGGQTYVPLIALRGTSGGAGFTATGLIDVGADTWLASLLSQLNPEENPGQETTFIDGLTGIESGNADVQAMDLGDYKLFRAAGIVALRFDGSTKIFQSGVTSVDPVQYPQLRNIARRRMADFIADSLAPRLSAYSKQLAQDVRRALILSEVEGFMSGLRSLDNPTNQRIADYKTDGKTGNTPEALGKGIFRVGVKARLLASFEAIVLDITAGEQVTISDNAAA